MPATTPSREIVLPENASGRLDSLLARLLPKVSRRELKAAFRAGKVRLDGRACRGSASASPGATVEISGLQEAPQAPTRSVSRQVYVVHADEHVVVVEKPANIPAYPLTYGEGGSVSEAVLDLFPDMNGVGDQRNAPGLCHRLDVETSGLLLFARSSFAFEEIRRQFQEKKVEKIYIAAVFGLLRGEGVIDVPLGRRSAKRMVAGPPETLRQWPALTRWRALRRADNRSLVELNLQTGVTHQARVHLAFLGHPVLGDEKYGGPPAERLGLHASRLGFIHPVTKRSLSLHSPRDESVSGMVPARAD